MRILSGMQPSGRPHLGNYLGAMRQHIELQKNNECFYFIADYHALTTIRDAAKLKQMTLDLAINYLSLGIDPEKTAFFRQSDVPEVTELAWILNTITPFGLAERCHAWKDAQQKNIKKEATVGLFNYPILMAADILIYQSDSVPVGKDQQQHIEITRDIALKFNQIYGETFRIPEPSIKKEVATVPGTDGQQKMSKSYGNVIEFFADEKTLKQQIMNIKTDSTSLEDPKDPSQCTVFHFYKLFATPTETKTLEKRYRAGNFGYGEAKTILLEKILAYFQKPRQKRVELEKDISYVENVLKQGAKKAQKITQETMQLVRQKVGLT